MRKQFTLGKNERLKSRKQIETLFAEGKSFAVSSFKIYYVVKDQSSMVDGKSFLQFGVGVGSRNFKRAVDRNRIKRLTRESWRLQNVELKEKLKNTGKQLNVFFIYTGKEIPRYDFVFEKMQASVQKLIRTVDQ